MSVVLVHLGAHDFVPVGGWPRGFYGRTQWERLHFQTDASHEQFSIVAPPLLSSFPPSLLLKSGLYVYVRRLRLLAT